MLQSHLSLFGRALFVTLAVSAGACSGESAETGGDGSNILGAKPGDEGSSPTGGDPGANGSGANGNGTEGTPQNGGGDMGGGLDLSHISEGERMSDQACIEVEVEFESVTPTVVLLIDRSGSMDADFDGGKDRWNTVRDTLTDPRDGLVKRLESKVRFGLSLYTSNDGGPTCPVMTEVEIALGNHGQIRSTFMDNEIGDDTPTAESVQAVTNQLIDFDEFGPKAIILATDGEPDNCVDPDAHNDATKAMVVSAVEDAYTAGVSTHVISVGDEISEDHLQDLAEAGAGGATDAVFYTALDTTALEGAFENIIRNVSSCDFELNGTVASGDAPLGTVSLDGQPLTHGDADGWEMPDDSTVRLLGAACDDVRLTAASLDIQFPCGVLAVR